VSGRLCVQNGLPRRLGVPHDADPQKPLLRRSCNRLWDKRAKPLRRRCMQRRTHQEFIRFLNAIENQVPANKQVHVVLDNYATHKHPKVVEWLGRHERFTFHFTPTSASWINAVEGFFAKLTKRRLKRGVFHSIVVSAQPGLMAACPRRVCWIAW